METTNLEVEGEEQKQKLMGHKNKHNKPKPWGDESIEHWKIEKFDPLWNEAEMVESKIGLSKPWCEVVIRVAKITAEMGVQGGIIDSTQDGVEYTIEAAAKLGEEIVSRGWMDRCTLRTRGLCLLRC
ncbi:hypothetical protein M9H77_08711 [Catharanthus roseus]|uniref:Uncharacterized protein n=1 Tax=Catharanthus roseus TaxID=4058 RepID=A0ACC0BYK5_CATRO|nr:hypothetical protein M9H77_08711 [Catharanthus roseus]